MLQSVLTLLSSNPRSKLTYKGEIFSSKQLIKRSLEIANSFKKLANNKPIAFYLPNSPELLCHYLACFHLGIPVVPIIYQEDISFVLSTIESIAPTHLFTTSEKKRQLPNIKNCKIEIIDDTFQALASIDLKAADKISIPNLSVSPEQLAMVVFSSGTSGMPKGIMHSYQSAYEFLQTLVEVLAIDHDVSYVVAQPMGHIGGIATTLITLLHNGTAILLDNFEINSYIQTLKKYKPTHINLHTPLFYQIMAIPNLDKTAFSQIRTCFAGGDDIPADLPTKFKQKTGAPMQVGYGMTEIGIVTVNRKPYDKHKGSCGLKINSVNIEIRDDHQQVVKPGEPGEIWVQSPACCIGYWNMKELNKKTLVDGWFRTGDLAYQEKDGFYWYLGRKNQVIYRGNHLVYPNTIEQVLSDYPDVNAAAVIAKNDAVEKEVPIAFVELKDQQNKAIVHDDIMKFISQKLLSWQMPQQLIILDKLPLNLTGKVDRGALKKMVHLSIR